MFMAAQHNQLDVVQCLCNVHGIDISKATHDDCTPLLYAADQGHLNVVKCLLVHAQRIAKANRHGHTLWGVLNFEGADDAGLASLLQVMVLLGDAPPDFIAKLSPQHAKLCIRGRQLRAHLPAYQEQQRASIVEHCPLPAVLQPLIAAYAAPTTDNIWTDGLREFVIECSISGCSGAGLLRCTACHQARFCGQSCQRAHWKAHKANCQRLRAELKAGQKASGK